MTFTLLRHDRGQAAQGGTVMRRLILAAAMGAMVCTAALQPAKAWGGGGVVVGTFAGLAAGTVVGAAFAHPYGPYPYPSYGAPSYYPAPAYPYPAPVYPAPVYPAPLVAAPYPYPYPYPYPPAPGYGAAGYAPPAHPLAAPGCGAGQFFNTYTGTCDRR